VTHAGSTTEPSLMKGASGPPSLLEYLTFLLRHRVKIALCALLPFAVVFVMRSLTPRTFTSTASFLPQGAESQAGLAGLAAQLGVGASAARRADVQTPAFYADIIKTPEILVPVLRAEYAFTAESGVVRQTLLEVLDPSGRTDEQRIDNAVREMRGAVRVTIQLRTGVVGFSVAVPNRELSRLVAQRILDEVNRLNLEMRQARASEERRFNEQRLSELRQELLASEERLEGFLRRNRDFRNSPELTFQRDRLARDVELRQSVYLTVAQAYERARVDQQRDTPVVSVVEKPSLPVRPDGRGRIRVGFFVLVLGSLAGVVLGLLQDFFTKKRMSADPDFEHYSQLMADIMEDARRLMFWRRRTSGR
jgi:uncharacterized protein involved in exopolysaccharide biosynthesis